jgi:hypothetical protein
MSEKPDAGEQAFLQAWDAEIDREEEDARNLRRRVRADQRTASLEARAANAGAAATLLQLAGVSAADVTRRADEEFERARKAADGRRQQALEALKSRIQSNAAEIQTLLGGVRKER